MSALIVTPSDAPESAFASARTHAAQVEGILGGAEMIRKGADPSRRAEIV